MKDIFQQKLDDLKAQNRLRGLRLPDGVDFSSNDYLGLSNHPRLRQAAITALEHGLPLGAGGSRLLRGHCPAHAELEEFAATYFACEKTLFFANGFQANQALIHALADRHDVIIFDEFIHASAREAIQHSPAQHQRVKHNDLNAFEDALKKANHATQRWLVVESVYSMDGDLAPLSDLHILAKRYNAMLIVDEAHATGIFGATGKGLTEALPHTPNLIVLHTCGKALGVAGGLVSASSTLIDYLINKARGFIYSTAPMPLQALLVKEALHIVADEPILREKLWDIHSYALKNLPIPVSPSQIVPVILGDDARALTAAEFLMQRGFDIRAIRPPTVPNGSARLRIVLNNHINHEQIDALAITVSEILSTKQNMEQAS